MNVHRRLAASALAALLLLPLATVPAAAGPCGGEGAIVGDDADADAGGAGPISEVTCLRASNDAAWMHVLVDVAAAEFADAFDHPDAFVAYDVDFTVEHGTVPTAYRVSVQHGGGETTAAFVDRVTTLHDGSRSATAAFEGATLRITFARSDVGDPPDGTAFSAFAVATSFCDFRSGACGADDVAPDGRDGAYVVRSIDLDDATPPLTPTLGATDRATDGEIALAWTASADAESGVSGYEVHRAIDGGAFALLARTSAGVLAYDDAGLANGVPHAYRVVALNGAGLAAASADVAVVPTRDTVAPPAVAGLVAAPGHERVDLAWSPSSAADLAAYRVHRNGERVATVAATAWTDAARPNGVEACYEVSAVDVYGNEGPRSATACATPIPPEAIPVVGWPQFHRDPALTGATRVHLRLEGAPALLARVAAPGAPAGVAWGDVHGDGARELVVAHRPGSVGAPAHVAAYAVTKGAPLVRLWDVALPKVDLAEHAAAWVSAPALVESGDGDAALEIVVAYGYEVGGAGVRVLEPHLGLLDGDGRVLASPVSGPVSARSHPVVANVDDDPAAEVILVTSSWSQSPSALRIHELGKGGVAATSVLPLPRAAVGDGTPAVVDLDGDGAPEIVVPLDHGNAAGAVWIVDGAGAQVADVPLATGAKGVAVADLDGDAALEIVVAGRDGPASLAVLDTAAGVEAYRVAAVAAAGKLWTTPSLGDVDGDRRADVVVAETNEYTDDLEHRGDVRVLSYRDGALAERGRIARAVRAADLEVPGGVLLADVEKGGPLEPVFGSRDGKVRGLAWRDGALVERWTWTAPGPVDAPLLAVDLFKGGAGDLVVADATGTLSVLGAP